jgi:hypothetical protein
MFNSNLYLIENIFLNTGSGVGAIIMAEIIGPLPFSRLLSSSPSPPLVLGVTGRAITNIRITSGRIDFLCRGSQVVDRSITRNLNMALQTISLYQEGDNTTNYSLLMAV